MHICSRERKEPKMKRLIALLLSIVLAAASFAALADTKITVKGTGEVRVSADTAVISLGVNARDKDVMTAQQKVNESIAAIRQALIDHGVKEENINTEFINIYAIYDYNNDQEQLAAYNASSTLAIRVTDMESVGTLIDICFAAGANTLNGISFSASDTEEANTEAMKKAVADAIKPDCILRNKCLFRLVPISDIKRPIRQKHADPLSVRRQHGFIHRKKKKKLF